MPATFSNLQFHVVFSTKERRPWIDSRLRSRLYDYIGGIIRGEEGVLGEIGGMADHIHLLIGWRTDVAVSNLVRNIKSRSSLWIHQTYPGLKSFAWQAGYAIFSVSQSQVDRVGNYIRRQEEHHKGKDYRQELIELLKAHQIVYDERHL